MSNIKTINKIKRTVEKKFSYYPETEDIIDLKEELLSIMLDKYNDLEDMTEKQKYNECLSLMMSSYKEVLHDLEIKSSRTVLKDKLLKFTLFSFSYFMIFVAAFLIIGHLFFESYKQATMIIIAPSILYLTFSAYYFWLYCKKMKFEVLKKICLGLIFFSLIAVVYVIPNLFLTFYTNFSFWHPSWLVILVIAYLYLVFDRLCYPISKPLFRLLNNCLNILFLGTIFFLALSLYIGHWHITWLVYVVCLIACEANLFLYFKNRL